jgi:hypothetical protein
MRFKVDLGWLMALLWGLTALLRVDFLQAADRVALVIGNNKYAYAPLDNAVNDARGMRERLRQLGFDVVSREDASRRDMNEALREFSGKLRNAEVALVFFAGHGMQHRGQNYLIPTDASLVEEGDIESEGFALNLLLTRLAQGGAAHNFVFLDACRNNPLGSRVRISQTGLASIEAELPRNTRLMYATAPGQVAYDSLISGQRNGAFTAGILKWLGVADLESSAMVQRISTSVFESTQTLKPPQNPYVNANSVREFYFGPRSSGSTVATVAPDTSNAARDAAVTQQDTEFWKEVRESGFRAELLRAYLRRFPAGGFSDIARLRLKELDDAVLATAPKAPDRAVASPPAPAVAAIPASGTTGASVATPSVSPAPVPAQAATVAGAVSPATSATQVAIALPSAASGVTAKPPPLEERYDEIDNKDFTYKGKVRGTRLHGSGEFFSKNEKFRYVGEFQDGKKHGKGEFEWPNGDKYAGPFVDDRPRGDGEFRFANGNVFKGEVDGAKMIRGEIRFPSGDRYTGAFDGTSPDGMGTYTFANGDVYEGGMRAGKMHGPMGRYRNAAGDTYIGDHVDGVREGRGKVTFAASGHEYEGEIRGGRLTGGGIYRFGASGMVYQGQLTDGVPDGMGVLRFPDGATLTGTFVKGTRNARGVLVDKDGNRRNVALVEGEYRFE